jgi:adenylate cyclase
MLKNGLEIERKFLVNYGKFYPIIERGKPSFTWINQCYFSNNPCIRLRSQIFGKSTEDPFSENPKFFYTYKGPGLLSRVEIDIEISLNVYNAFEPKNLPYVFKRRYVFEYKGKKWEIDQFYDCNKKNLWIAEIELSNEDEKFEIPDFCIEEVTNNEEYSNMNLVIHPNL